VEQFSAVPEDDRVHEKTKRRICCALPADSEAASSSSSSRVVTKFESPQSGLAERGLPAATIEVTTNPLTTPISTTPSKLESNARCPMTTWWVPGLATGARGSSRSQRSGRRG
jgi:hypothetical protein